MNAWLWCGAALLGAGVPAVVWGVASGPLARRVLVQNAGSTVVALAFLLIAQGYGRPSYVDLSLVLSLLGPAGTLVYVRLLADDLPVGRPRGATAVTALCVAGSLTVTVAVCAATPFGRPMLKLLLIGTLVSFGNVIASRALSVGVVKKADAAR
ncbi:monovalent cation/H+ antiporter complex subunit F [Streptomyces sp. NPDC127108]|uniref:monovalent cation/H+ antiporter complex subunit F n=1 Tax=Streptomyces sp. NPDC127108 TaxID=3345361 RepID=UPI00363C383F